MTQLQEEYRTQSEKIRMKITREEAAHERAAAQKRELEIVRPSLHPFFAHSTAGAERLAAQPVRHASCSKADCTLHLQRTLSPYIRLKEHMISHQEHIKPSPYSASNPRDFTAKYARLLKLGEEHIINNPLRFLVEVPSSTPEDKNMLKTRTKALLQQVSSSTRPGHLE